MPVCVLCANCVSLQDCSDVNDRRGCLMLECTIPSLSGLSVEHKVTLAGYIDTRFFNVSIYRVVGNFGKAFNLGDLVENVG